MQRGILRQSQFLSRDHSRAVPMIFIPKWRDYSRHGTPWAPINWNTEKSIIEQGKRN
jgi:hypothetical protein